MDLIYIYESPEIQVERTSDSNLVHEIVSASNLKMQKDHNLSHWNYYTIEVVEEKIATGNVFLLKYNDQPAGVFCVTTIPHAFILEEPACIEAYSEPGKAMYLSMFTVHIDFRGRGLGKIILQKVEEMARAEGCKFIRFDARKDYEKLIEFYKSQGYIEKGIFSETNDENASIENYSLFEKRIVSDD